MPRRAAPRSFAGDVAVVTGAGGQIGRALLERLTGAGATAVGLDLPAACPDGDDRFVACDLTDEGQVRAAVEEVGRRYGRIDLLVHSAALSAIGQFEDHDVATHRRSRWTAQDARTDGGAGDEPDACPAFHHGGGPADR